MVQLEPLTEMVEAAVPLSCSSMLAAPSGHEPARVIVFALVGLAGVEPVMAVLPLEVVPTVKLTVVFPVLALVSGFETSFA